MTDTAAQKPLPRIAPDNEPFWAGLRERRLLLPFCNECGKPHLPPGPVCPFCFSDAIEWRRGQRPRPPLHLDGGAQGVVPAFRATFPITSRRSNSTKGRA